MSWSALTTGIVALVNADTGTGGLRNASDPLITAVYSNHAPQDAVIPYSVVLLVSDVEEKAFSASPRSIQYGVQISTWTSRDGGDAEGQSIVDRLRTVLDRIAPTVSGFSSSQMLRQGGSVLVEDEFYHHIEEYNVHLGT